MEITLKSLFIKFMSDYASELLDARTTDNYKRPFGSLVRRDIAGLLQSKIMNPNYKVKGSVGAGRWTDVPWVAVFDTRITTSAQKGVYIVYLLNKDTKTLYLTLNQGATDVAQDGGVATDGKLAFTGIATADNTKTTDSLKVRAQKYYNTIPNDEHIAHGMISSGSKAYDAGCIFYKEYHVGRKLSILLDTFFSRNFYAAFCRES